MWGGGGGVCANYSATIKSGIHEGRLCRYLDNLCSERVILGSGILTEDGLEL